MLRITRLVASNRLADIVNLEGVCKIELKQGKQKGLRKPISKVQIYLLPDAHLLNSYLGNMRTLALQTGNNKLRIVADTAQRDHFIREAAFIKFNYPMPRHYKKYCDKYSQEFFNTFGDERRIMQ